MDKKDKKKPVLIGSIILIVFVLIAGFFCIRWLYHTIRFVSTEDARIEGNHVSVSAKMLGRIKTIFVNEGDAVAVGQLLIQLDDADLRAQEGQASASLNYAKQNLLLSKVNLEKAQNDFYRIKNLFTVGAATKEQYDHASKALDAVNAQFIMTQSQIDTANAQLMVIETQLLNTKLTAAISGIIAKQAFMPGDVVQPGQSIITINNLSELWVIANFEETKIRNIRVNAPAEISIDAYPSYHFKGKVTRISAGIVPPPFSIGDFTKTTQRIPVKISITNIQQSMLLLPGMSVVARVSIFN